MSDQNDNKSVAKAVYLERATNSLRVNGQAFDPALRQHLSPLGWEHINLTGDFRTYLLSDSEGQPSTRTVPRADIAFCVAALAIGMTEDRIERTLEDDYLSRDPSPTKRAAYVGNMVLSEDIGAGDGGKLRPKPTLVLSPSKSVGPRSRTVQ